MSISSWLFCMGGFFHLAYFEMRAHLQNLPQWVDRSVGRSVGHTFKSTLCRCLDRYRASMDHGTWCIFWQLWPTAFRLWFPQGIFPKCIFCTVVYLCICVQLRTSYLLFPAEVLSVSSVGQLEELHLGLITFGHLCICLIVCLLICVFVYLCICVFVYYSCHSVSSVGQLEELHLGLITLGHFGERNGRTGRT